MNFQFIHALGVVDFTQFVLGTIAIILLPGPNSLYVLATAAKRGVRLGFLAALGVLIGDALLMWASATGVSTLLKTFPHAYLALKWGGAVYLAWIGLNLILAGVAKWRNRFADKASLDLAANANAVEMQPTKAALMLSLTNPKAIFFFISFFTQFVDASAANPGLAFLLLASVLQLISFIYLSALIVTGASLSKMFYERTHLAVIGMVAVGFIFAGFGLKLVIG